MLALSHPEEQSGGVVGAPLVVLQLERSAELLEGILEAVHAERALARQAVVMSSTLYCFRSCAVEMTGKVSCASFEISRGAPFQRFPYFQMKHGSSSGRYLLDQDVLNQGMCELVATWSSPSLGDYAVGNRLL
jgi:hypothetical protein